MLDTTGLFNPLESAAHKLCRLMQTVEKKVHKELNVMSPGIITAVNPAKSQVSVRLLEKYEDTHEILLNNIPFMRLAAGKSLINMAPQAGDECIVIFANDSWYRVIRSNDPNLEKIKHPRHDLNHGIALVGMALNPARPDRERTMREAPSPKEGVLEISNGESSLALNEQGLMSLQNGKGGITLAENGRFAVRNGNEELLHLFDSLLGVLIGLTTTGSSSTQQILHTQSEQIKLIKDKLAGFLMRRSEEDGTDNPKDDDKIEDEIADEDEIEEEDEEMNRRVQDRLILQTDERFRATHNVIRTHGCNLRIMQAIGEILADEYFVALNRDRDEAQRITPESRVLTVEQIMQLYNDGVTANWSEVEDWEAMQRSGKYIFTGTRVVNGVTSTFNCSVRNPDMAIAGAMAMLNVPTEANGGPRRPIHRDHTTGNQVNDTRAMNSRFVRHEHETFVGGRQSTHFTLTDRTRGIYWDPDPAVLDVIRKRYEEVRYFGFRA